MADALLYALIYFFFVLFPQALGKKFWVLANITFYGIKLKKVSVRLVQAYTCFTLFCEVVFITKSKLFFMKAQV